MGPPLSGLFAQDLPLQLDQHVGGDVVISAHVGHVAVGRHCNKGNSYDFPDVGVLRQFVETLRHLARQSRAYRDNLAHFVPRCFSSSMSPNPEIPPRYGRSAGGVMPRWVVLTASYSLRSIFRSSMSRS